MSNRNGKTGRRQHFADDSGMSQRRTRQEERAARKEANRQGGRPQRGDNWNTPKLVCKTKAQSRYLQQLDSLQLVFGLGPAGTGKTYVATMRAAKLLQDNRIERIIVTRPNVEVGAPMGFLPGDEDEKCAPWFKPVLQILEQFFGRGALESHLKNENIVFEPLGFVRGLTFDNCVVLLDEAQNSSREQMFALLTRMGEYGQLVIDGDLEQDDLKGDNGLVEALAFLKNEEFVGITEFTEDDIVRSAMVKSIVKAYRRGRRELAEQAA